MGQLVAATLVVTIILSNLSRLQNFFLSIYDFSTALDKIAEFYDHPLEEEKINSRTPQTYDFELKQIFHPPNFYFDTSFPEKSRNLILIKSFSAKNIFLNLMFGLKPFEKGDLSIGGINHHDIGWGQIRNFLTIVKEGQFFNGTIRENITSFIPHEVSYTELDEALTMVGLKDNIHNLPLKLETVIEPSGYPLSHSQLMALQFARVYLSKPKILIVSSDFEEISSSKRHKIFEMITDKCQPWTLLFFTHRAYPQNYFESFHAITRKNISQYKNYQEFLGDLINYEQSQTPH